MAEGRHDLAIHFDGDAARRLVAELTEQLQYGNCLGQRAPLAVEGDLEHRHIRQFISEPEA